MACPTVVVIANPAAGSLRTRRVERFAASLGAAGARADIRWTRAAGIRRGHLDLGGAADVFVAAGGDGTLNQVANALFQERRSTPLGFLPLGTANVFAHEARLPAGDEALARLVARGEAEDYPLILGRYNGLDGGEEERVGLLMAGVGWDARLTFSVDRAVKSRHGKGAYVAAGLKLVLGGGRREVRFLADGREMPAEAVIAANSPYYGGPFKLMPRTDRSGPEMDFAAIGRMSLGTVLPILARVLAGRPAASGNLVYGRARVLAFPAPGTPIQMDGDPVGHTPAVFSRPDWKLRVIRGPGGP